MINQIQSKLPYFVGALVSGFIFYNLYLFEDLIPFPIIRWIVLGLIVFSLIIFFISIYFRNKAREKMSG